MWLWRAHNQVNERLIPIERAHGRSEGSDPAHPKTVWPPAELCAACRQRGAAVGAAGNGPSGESGEPIMWDLEEVHLFMLR